MRRGSFQRGQGEFIDTQRTGQRILLDLGDILTPAKG